MADELITGANSAAPPLLFGRPTARNLDSPELVGSIVAELSHNERSRQNGRQGIPAADVTRELPATAPANRFSAIRARQIRSHRLDCNLGLADSLINQRGNVLHYRRSETGPAGVLVRFDDAGAEQVWLPAGGVIAGALFDRVFVSCVAAVGGFATLTIADDPRQAALYFGTAAV